MTEQSATARCAVVSTEDDGRLRLEFTRSWPDPIEDVWSALTEPDRLARWIGTYDGERAPGGTGTFTMTHEEGGAAGEPMAVVECGPPRRLAVEWVQQDTDAWRVDVDLESDSGGTVLRFVQRFPAGTDVTDFALGWHWYLDKLDAEVGRRPAPADWADFLAEVGPAYGR
ncbi:SRPBCC domain-containing protein [Geodermatophilus sp. DSM 45219]|uniref:SRPBCC domain-containing protein n=1 Tax=Geodermatophilus sp. DSM 45219 TaxID=1881103 RepID=UPI00089175C7|nr:SRPBCC domain-containing protein [Geodermatophilus sp. DSM 45219]SDN99376.1 Uncharacterized conserved protein YndB, AHSA1/START domain [Geodermatophilus sp. DSM 45219]